MIERKGIFCLFGFNRDVRDLVHSQTTFCEFKKSTQRLVEGKKQMIVRRVEKTGLLEHG